MSDETTNEADKLEAEQPKLLSAEQILSSDDREFVDTYVPAWNGSVRLRALSAQEAIDFMNSNKKRESMILIVAMSAVDEDGNRLFKGTSAIAELKKKSVSSFILLQKSAMRLNGFDDDDNDAKND